MPKFASKFLLMAIVLMAGTHANAVVTIEIDEGVKRGIPIAIVPFGLPEGIDQEFDLDEVIRSDLSRTGRFEVKELESFLQTPTIVEDVVFADWQLIGVDYLVIGSLQRIEEGIFRTEARLFNVFNEKLIFGSQFLITADNDRKVMHHIANEVYQRVTGAKSSFNTKIAYSVASVSSEGKPEHKLVVSDYDGFNATTILKSENPILSPSWSPNSNMIAYSILDRDQSKIWIQDVSSGDRRVVANIEGQNRSPSWSPDGSRLAFTNSIEGNSDIFVYTFASGEIIRLTSHRRIDTEPAWSPDSDYIVFTSNRGKGAQIYRVRAKENQTIERMTIYGKSNSQASYSPSGKQLILITDQGKGNQVGILDVETKTVSVVSSTSIDDSAVFSPNGELLMYIVEGRDRHIGILSPDGGVRSRIKVIDGAVKQVAWGSDN
ncbi:MAG: Tol-Pal system beta propeller repeat protein TolB [Acidiferrobacterales bacterium]|nr:Tol-Pal system beta propeller repeat protein TolB [Acidiferrobacterales bacterium]